MNFNFTALLINILILTSFHHTIADIQEYYPHERDALIEFRESVRSPIIDLHSRWTGPPCTNNNANWVGIACFDGHVTRIVLDGMQLRGLLPPTFLPKITYLTKLSFRNNSLLGSLPDLSGLRNLQNVFLSQNLFSNPIPNHYIDLPKLSLLELQENILTGAIPPFNQPTLNVFNVSHNSLDGEIPQTSTLMKFTEDSFSNNLQLCGNPLPKVCPSPNPNPPPSKPDKKKKPLNVWSIVLIAVSAALIPFIIMLILLCYLKKLHLLRGEEETEDKSDELSAQKKTGTDPERRVSLEFFNKEKPMFDLDDLLRASAELLGKGKLGSTYKVTLDTSLTVAVKRLKDMNGLDRKGFVQQMQLLGNMKHENLPEIVSFYYSKEEKLVVYEYVPNDGSLFDLLHESRETAGRIALNWNTRLTIIKGVAEGLNYLHESLASHKVPHANLKSTNILVSRHSNNNSIQIKLTGFGFLPLLPTRKASSEKLAVGRCPEFCQGKKMTHKADVYCFGIVLLEVITGRKVPPQSTSDTSKDDLSDWVRTTTENDWSTDILDLEISSTKDAHEDMLKLAEIALDCTSVEPEKRPKMTRVMTQIQSLK
ncbi:hypothetical protein ACHQM5_027378 [Ranunculus cassubicifolius]